MFSQHDTNGKGSRLQWAKMNKESALTLFERTPLHLVAGFSLLMMKLCGAQTQAFGNAVR